MAGIASGTSAIDAGKSCGAASPAVAAVDTEAARVDMAIATAATHSAVTAVTVTCAAAPTGASIPAGPGVAASPGARDTRAGGAVRAGPTIAAGPAGTAVTADTRAVGG